MTIAANDRRYEYPGNGTAAGPFTGPKLFDADHLLAYIVNDTTGASTALIEGSDFTLEGVGLAQSSVTLSAAHASGTTLLLLRTVPYVQDTSIRNLGKFFPEIHEDAFDKIVQMIQQLADLVGRSPAFAETVLTSDLSLSLPAPVGNSFWKWNADGTAITFVQQVEYDPGVIASTFGGTLVESADAGAAKTILELGIFAGTAWNSLPAEVIIGRTTGSGVAQQISCTAAGRTLLAASTAGVQRTALGLGTIATQAANAVAITGGSLASVRVGELTQTITHNASGALAIDLSLGHYVVVNQSAAITDVTFSNVPAGQAVTVTIERVKDNSGTSRAITWPAAILFPGGVDPTLTQTANGRDAITLVTRDGGTSWLGSGAAGFA